MPEGQRVAKRRFADQLVDGVVATDIFAHGGDMQRTVVGNAHGGGGVKSAGSLEEVLGGAQLLWEPQQCGTADSSDRLHAPESLGHVSSDAFPQIPHDAVATVVRAGMRATSNWERR